MKLFIVGLVENGMSYGPDIFEAPGYMEALASAKRHYSSCHNIELKGDRFIAQKVITLEPIRYVPITPSERVTLTALPNQ